MLHPHSYKPVQASVAGMQKFEIVLPLDQLLLRFLLFFVSIDINIGVTIDVDIDVTVRALP